MRVMRNVKISSTAVVLAAAVGIVYAGAGAVTAQQGAKPKVPQFEWDPTWPKMPPNKVLGTISGLWVDKNDQILVTHRPATLETYERDFMQNTECCQPLPPVSIFDTTGKFLRGIGPIAYVAPPAGSVTQGAGANMIAPSQPSDRPEKWPKYEHGGAYIDYKGNMWLAGNGEGDHQVVKMTPDGKFLMQIGTPGAAKGNKDTQNLNQPTKVAVWPATNEVFVGDGYVNRRVIVFDADTGAYKRMWGAYGNVPTDPPDPLTRRTRKREDTGSGRGPDQFNLVHALNISNDGFVYVADRINNRVQVFTIDGKYVTEAFAPNRKSIGNGAAFDLAFSPDAAQTYLYVADNTNGKVQIFDRKSMQHLAGFGQMGNQPGQWNRVHSIAVDSKGNIYTGETGGKKVQRFLFKGLK
jgi:DNA-binding beta-propeller fold protein YncE